MEAKKTICTKMNNILKDWKNVLPNTILAEDFSQLTKIIDTLEINQIYFSSVFRATTPVIFFIKFINPPAFATNYKNFVVFFVKYQIIYTVNLNTLKIEPFVDEDYRKFIETSVGILNSDVYTYGKCYSQVSQHEESNIKSLVVRNIYNFINTNYTVARNVPLKAINYGDTVVYYKIFYYYN